MIEEKEIEIKQWENCMDLGQKYSGFFYNRNVVGNNPETAGAGEDRQNSFRRLFLQVLYAQ